MATDHRGRDVHAGKRSDDEYYEMALASVSPARRVFNPNVTDYGDGVGSTAMTKAEHTAFVNSKKDTSPAVKQHGKPGGGRVKSPRDWDIDGYENRIMY